MCFNLMFILACHKLCLWWPGCLLVLDVLARLAVILPFLALHHSEFVTWSLVISSFFSPTSFVTLRESRMASPRLIGWVKDVSSSSELSSTLVSRSCKRPTLCPSDLISPKSLRRPQPLIPMHFRHQTQSVLSLFSTFLCFNMASSIDSALYNYGVCHLDISCPPLIPYCIARHEYAWDKTSGLTLFSDNPFLSCSTWLSSAIRKEGTSLWKKEPASLWSMKTADPDFHIIT